MESNTTDSGTTPGGSASSARDPLVDRLAQGAHAAIDRMAEKAGPAVESFNAKAGEFSSMEEEWLQTARTCVRDHPIASITLAVVAGMMLGRMVR